MSVPMIERSQIFEVTQWGVESLASPGVGVPATNRLEAIGVTLSPGIEVDRFRPFGNKHDTLLIPGKDYTNIELTGRLDYNNILYPLSSVVGNGVATTVGTNGREWKFRSNSFGPDAFRTYTVESGSFVRAQKATGVYINDLGFAFRRGSVELSGSGMGRLFTDGSFMTGDAVYRVTLDDNATGGTFTLTYSAQTTSAIAYNATAAQIQTALEGLSNIDPGEVRVTGGPVNSAPVFITFTGALGNQPITMTASFASITPAPGTSAATSVQTGVAVTALSALPVIPGNVNVYYDTEFANIGTTKLTRVFEADVNLASRFNPMWTLDSSQSSFAATVETAPEITARLKLAANQVGMGFLETIRSGETGYLRIESTGPAMPSPDTGENYLFRVDMAVKVESPDDFGELDGAMSVDWSFRAVDDGDFGGAYEFTVQNLTTAL